MQAQDVKTTHGPLNLSVDDIIRLAAYEVKPLWVKALYEAGLNDLFIDQIIILAEH